MVQAELAGVPLAATLAAPGGTVAISVMLVLSVVLIVLGVVLIRAKKTLIGLVVLGVGIFLFVGDTVFGHKLWSAIQGALHGWQVGWHRG